MIMDTWYMYLKRRINILFPGAREVLAGSLANNAQRLKSSQQTLCFSRWFDSIWLHKYPRTGDSNNITPCR
jgi:hypothetical protein